MDRLLEGYRRFRDSSWPEHKQRFMELAERGQTPETLVIACSDSRVDPQMIFGAGPGELFIVRNVAALVPPYQPDQAYHGTSAALEFGVKSLGVRRIIVIGHGLCGGVAGLLKGIPDELGDFVRPWMSLAEPAKRRVLTCEPADPQLEGEHEVVKLSLANLRTFPWIRDREADGRLTLAGAHFDVRYGRLAMLSGDTFQPVG
jgi:carbonic anhydrase